MRLLHHHYHPGSSEQGRVQSREECKCRGKCVPVDAPFRLLLHGLPRTYEHVQCTVEKCEIDYCMNEYAWGRGSTALALAVLIDPLAF